MGAFRTIEEKILAKFRLVDAQYGKGETPLLVEDFRKCIDAKDYIISRVLRKMTKEGKLTCAKFDRRNAYLLAKEANES